MPPTRPHPRLRYQILREQSPSWKTMGTIAGVIFLTTTPLIRPRGLVGRFPNLHCPSSKFSHCRTTANTATDAPPFQVSAAASSPSSAIDEEKEVTSSGNVGADDLLIVGPGVLGRLVAQKWREEHPGCQIHGQTVTADHHEELNEEGINPCLKGTKTTHKFPYVIFCAPPSRTSDYSADVRMAALNWNGEGSFLFTSSSAPYDCNNNGSCDEDTSVVPIGRNPRTDVLLKAEEVVLEFGGVVLRLAALYTSFMKVDAASLSVAILKKRLRNQILLGCDNHPLSRQEVMDLVTKSGKFSETFEAFTGTNDPLGKRLNNSKTREEIGWEPKYPSFAHFLESL
ncbi:hypothetical protein C1H46_034396 [Malus baccata]|uniref:NAD-dependent epimerase/dehydratase domain-containing protein n=1 Tax=Malus baccata TaxID=106549 RepID=A0A540L0L2_MALBA|nr:hypothetical protein C1H46_034396 [Malus baccata]